MSKVIIYSSAHCPYCTMAKQLLDRKGVSYDEIRVDQHPEKRQEMMQKVSNVPCRKYSLMVNQWVDIPIWLISTVRGSSTFY